MTEIVQYEDSFSDEERSILERFQAVIENDWSPCSCSTATLRWFLEEQECEPRRYAVLKTRAAQEVIHRESFYSLENKNMDVFESEFRSAAHRYASDHP